MNMLDVINNTGKHTELLKEYYEFIDKITNTVKDLDGFVVDEDAVISFAIDILVYDKENNICIDKKMAKGPKKHLLNKLDDFISVIEDEEDDYIMI